MQAFKDISIVFSGNYFQKLNVQWRRWDIFDIVKAIADEFSLAWDELPFRNRRGFSHKEAQGQSPAWWNLRAFVRACGRAGVRALRQSIILEGTWRTTVGSVCQSCAQLPLCVKIRTYCEMEARFKQKKTHQQWLCRCSKPFIAAIELSTFSSNYLKTQ